MEVDLSVFGRQKSIVDQQQLQEAFNLKKALGAAQIGALQQKAQSDAMGGSLPAPMQIADKMFGLKKRALDPRLTDQERADANTEYNLLGQAAKTYGFDRGIEYNMQPAFNPQPAQPPQQGTVGAKPRDSNMEMYTPPEQDYIDMPLPPTQGGYDFSNDPELQPVKTPQFAGNNNIRPMAGFGGAVGSIAADKKGMEQDAKNRSDLTYGGQIAAEKARGAEEGKARGEKEVLLATYEANLPELTKTVGDLSQLSETATFTEAGKATDYVLKQFGVATEGATDRVEYTAKARNFILPLLRQTFGAAFTAKEGETLMETLGDPDATPEAKKATLDAFMAEKYAGIRSAQRYLGKPVSTEQAPTYRTPVIPEGAANYLLQNPSAANDFDAKYGAGASAKILGQ